MSPSSFSPCTCTSWRAEGCTCQVRLICLESLLERSSELLPARIKHIHSSAKSLHSVMNKISELFRLLFPLSMPDRSPGSPGWENRTPALYHHSSVPGDTHLSTIPDEQTFPSQLAEGKQQFVLSLPS